MRPVAPLQHKVWGTDLTVFNKNCVEAHHMHLTPCTTTGSSVKCSTHTHEVKHNMFYVLKGSVTVVTIRGKGHFISEYEKTLGVGECFHVSPGIKHYFRVDVPAEIIEFVWAEGLHADIDREEVGRVLDDE